MTNRILLNASGLKISKPGANVLAAGVADLQFSSDYSGVGYAQSGSFTVGAGESNVFTPIDKVTFNKTFSRPPFCMFYLLDGGNRYFVGAGGLYFALYTFTGGSFREVQSSISTTKISVFCRSTPGGGTIPNLTFEYHVLEFGLP